MLQKLYIDQGPAAQGVAALLPDVAGGARGADRVHPRTAKGLSGGGRRVEKTINCNCAFLIITIFDSADIGCVFMCNWRLLNVLWFQLLYIIHIECK